MSAETRRRWERRTELERAQLERERALILLKEQPLFRHTSRRLLSDLAGRSVLRELAHSSEEGPELQQYISEASAPYVGPDAVRLDGNVLAVVVLEGIAIAASEPVGPRPPFPSPLVLPAVQAVHDVRLRPVAHAPPPAVELTAGVYVRGLGLPPFPGGVRLEPPRDSRVRLLVLDDSVLGLSRSLAASLDPTGSDFVIAALNGQVTAPEMIWLAAGPEWQDAIEPLQHILAAQIARDFPSFGVALVTAGSSLDISVWQAGTFTNFTGAFSSVPKKSDFSSLPGGTDGYVFAFNPAAPLVRPASLAQVEFDRVVWLGEPVPQAVPSQIQTVLNPGVVDHGVPEFTSFMAAVTVPKDAPATRSAGPEFEALPLPPHDPEDFDLRARQAISRDCCTVPLDRDALASAWSAWNAAPGGAPFLDQALARDAVSSDAVERWARAVTHRRVGVAISGGGASAYRIGPVLDVMESHAVPVDIVAGLSGGALVGAFFCAGGLEGLEWARALGPYFQLTLPTVIAWTWPLELSLDFFLGWARVEQLPVRLAAVAVALPEEERPRATVINRATLGAAVRASGALPPSFAPTTKNCVRYTDGGAGTVVPAIVARECGADVTIAVNVVPGPAFGNPYGGLPGGFLLRQWPLLGRYLDIYTWYSFFFEQTSRAFGRAADVFLDFEPQRFPMFESNLFALASLIHAAAATPENEIEIEKVVTELEQKWALLGP